MLRACLALSLLSGCTTYVTAPRPAYRIQRALIEPVRVSVDVRAQRSGKIGKHVDGAAMMEQGAYMIEGDLKTVLRSRLEDAALMAGLTPGQGAAPLRLDADLPTLEVTTRGMFASGSGADVVVNGTMTLSDAQGPIYTDALTGNAAGVDSNDPEALFPVLDKAVSEWFMRFKERVASDAAVSGRLVSSRSGAAATTAAPAGATPIAGTGGAAPPAAPTYEDPDGDPATRARESSGGRVGRIFLSPVMGFLIGGAGSAALVFVVNGTCGDSGYHFSTSIDGNDECAFWGTLADLTLWTFTTAAGVALSGAMLDGEAGYGTALLGSLLGVLASFAGSAQADDPVAAFALGKLFATFMAPLGSMVVYELTAYMTENRLQSNSGISVVPVVQPIARGLDGRTDGMVGSLVIQF
jgi:hypothetical protein